MATLLREHAELGTLLDERAPQRAKLLEAMVEAVAEKGYASATVADAVRLARVSRGTFYELFESKEACLRAAYRAGCEVLEGRVAAAVRGAADWREELRLGVRTYLETLEHEPRFARVFLVEASVIAAEREAAMHRFAARYGRTFARSGRPVPPPDALYLLAAGIAELAGARARRGAGVLDLEDTLVGCAVRLASTEEEPWT